MDCNLVILSYETIHLEIIDSQSECANNSFEDLAIFEANDELEDNIFTTVSEQLLYACKLCHVKAASLKDLKRHSNLAHSVNTKHFKCSLCKHKFTRKYSLKIHIQRVHKVNVEDSHLLLTINNDEEESIAKRSADTIYSCRFCNFTTTNVMNLRDHAKKVHNIDERPFKCHICKKRFTRQFILDVHIKKMHGNKVEERVLCQICGKYYYSDINLAIHMKRHLDIKEFRCHKCGKAFVTEPILRRHLIGHTGKKPYNCHVCGKSFFGKTKFEIHKMVHTGGKAYICNVCHKFFIERKDLDIHKITYHNVNAL